MTFLRTRRTDLTRLFWADLVEYVARHLHNDEIAVPTVIGELARGDVSVVCDRTEADEALAWARALPWWPAHLPAENEPLYIVDSRRAE
jgi:hypothetical protein